MARICTYGLVGLKALCGNEVRQLHPTILGPTGGVLLLAYGYPASYAVRRARSSLTSVKRRADGLVSSELITRLAFYQLGER